MVFWQIAFLLFRSSLLAFTAHPLQGSTHPSYRSMLVKNNSHYFTEHSKMFNVIPDTNSFRYQSSRRMGYFQRIYFEHQYTLKVKGQSFFYTFTYNDKSIPHFTIKDPKSGLNIIDRPSFSYKDIRYITNGSLSKTLYRKYGSRLRYFCACETGEGKGKRGEGNNPHYHFIFFVQPIHDKDGNPVYDNYKPINSFDFRKLLNELWLGTNEYIRFQDAKFGIVQPGKFNGVIQSADAFKYVGKYVIKDASEQYFEFELSRHYFNEVVHRGITPEVMVDYLKYCRYYLGADFHFQEFVDQLCLREYRAWLKRDPQNVNFDYNSFITWSGNNYLDAKVVLLEMRDWFDKNYVPWYVSMRMSQYKSEYSGKPRMSKSLGEYGLNFISDVDSQPRITIPVGDKYEVQFPCLYYMRKLYYNAFICPVSGNVLYELSDLGKKLKKNQLYSSINNFIYNTQQNISYVLKNNLPVIESSNPLDCSDLDQLDVFNVYKEDSVFDDHSDLIKADLSKIKTLINFPDYDRILLAYSVYKNVYEFRHFKEGYMPVITSELFSYDVLRDYEFFISQDKHSIDYDDSSVYLLLSCDTRRRFKSYSQIEPFSRYLEWFKLLDLINSFCDTIHSEFSKTRFKEKSEYLKKMNAFLHTPMVL